MLEAGIDKINISVDGMTVEQYMQFTGFKFDFPTFIENVKWIYENKGDTEISIKNPGELITEDQRRSSSTRSAITATASSSRISPPAGRNSTSRSTRA